MRTTTATLLLLGLGGPAAAEGPAQASAAEGPVPESLSGTWRRESSLGAAHDEELTIFPDGSFRRRFSVLPPPRTPPIPGLGDSRPHCRYEQRGSVRVARPSAGEPSGDRALDHRLTFHVRRLDLVEANLAVVLDCQMATDVWRRAPAWMRRNFPFLPDTMELLETGDGVVRDPLLGVEYVKE